MRYDKREILSRLTLSDYQRLVPSLKQGAGDTAQGLCPFHDDHRPSLTVNLDTGGYKCFGCGASGDAYNLFMKVNGGDFRSSLETLAGWAGITGQTDMRRGTKSYEYHDEVGGLLYQVVRFEPKDFRQRRPDSKGGWIWDLRDTRRVLYNLPAVMQAQEIFLVEGEKDADNLNRMGLVATTCPMGAGKWRPEYTESLKGKDVVILHDNDEPGRRHAQAVAQDLQDKAGSIKVVELPGLPEKGDVSDWLEAGHTKDELIRIFLETPEWEVSSCPDIYTGQPDTSDISPLSFLKKGSELQVLECNIEWCIDKLLPKQGITLLHGKGGIGKTWVSLVMAEAISTGSPFMGLEARKSEVVFVDFENSLPVLVDRVRKIGIKDAWFWHNSNDVSKPPKLDSHEWGSYKRLPPNALLIFDTLRASQNKDENDSQHMAFILSRLKDLRDMGFTILLLHHTPKGNDRTYKGSTAILDLADHVLSMHKVRKGNLEAEADDDDDRDCLYRLGTKDKTRYEPFHIFMAFDPERGFVIAPDPNEGHQQDIRAVLIERGRMNQNRLFEVVKEELEIKGKGKLLRLLSMGEGKYWTSQKEGKAIVYEALGTVQVSGPYMWTDGQTNPEIPQLSGVTETDTPADSPKLLDNKKLSNCPGSPWTDGTDDAVEVTEVLDEIPASG